MYGIAFLVALAILIRPTNISFLLIYFLYDVYSWKQLKARISWQIKNMKIIYTMLIIGILLAIPQICYWYTVTGSPVVFSYQNEGFTNASSPKILQVLFGHRNGWLFFSPIMILSIIGLVIAWWKKILSAPAITFAFLFILYWSASWWCWDFGCSFGYRPFVEYLPIMALPFALVINYIFRSRSFVRIIAGVVFFALIFVNVKLIRINASESVCWDGDDWTFDQQMQMIQKIDDPGFDLFR
jgi:hypothetical protein